MSAPAAGTGSPAPSAGQPHGGPGNFQVLNRTQAEEDAYDYKLYRSIAKPTGVIASIAHIVKGALGGGILGAHVAYSKAGIATAIPINFLLGTYLSICLHLLVESAQVLYRRTKVPSMSYSDVGEAAMSCFPNPKIRKFSKPFRYTIDLLISLDLFGACACYQLIIAKTIKQLVENTQESSEEPLIEGGWHLRVYLAIMIVPVICICLITHLKWLAPFSLGANIVVGIAIIMAIGYAFNNNPGFTGMTLVTTVYQQFEYMGMLVFGMSCAGVVLPIENNMKEPHKFKIALFIGMAAIVFCTFFVSFFGYAAFLDKCTSPISLNFSMNMATKIFKGCVAAMIYVTHALNFWVPFNLCFYYIKIRVHPSKALMWELICRALFVTGVGIIAIVFPNINNLMGFLGAFCLSNMAFIWPNIITLLVIWERPGFGKYRWRLWRSVVFLLIGFFLFVCGSIVNINELLSVFK
ncbi:proton-coupled amino acid transporter-like protein pathetic [Amyelois transitella]|uniref:proton-coupled amino acid transporter-like protein pathetic n=1 Tax=Amyelois transitella TaxID=680683 RepID=UPI00298FE8BD|nr:proton-coupled amino acid transporter-like protein pathetic [Amyelois transitella]